jgi:hypothetical protein
LGGRKNKGKKWQFVLSKHSYALSLPTQSFSMWHCPVSQYCSFLANEILAGRVLCDFQGKVSILHWSPLEWLLLDLTCHFSKKPEQSTRSPCERNQSCQLKPDSVTNHLLSQWKWVFRHSVKHRQTFSSEPSQKCRFLNKTINHCV